MYCISGVGRALAFLWHLAGEVYLAECIWRIVQSHYHRSRCQVKFYNEVSHSAVIRGLRVLPQRDVPSYGYKWPSRGIPCLACRYSPSLHMKQTRLLHLIKASGRNPRPIQSLARASSGVGYLQTPQAIQGLSPPPTRIEELSPVPALAKNSANSSKHQAVWQCDQPRSSTRTSATMSAMDRDVLPDTCV